MLMFSSIVLLLSLSSHQAGLEEVIAPPAQLEQIATGFELACAPLWKADGSVLVADTATGNVIAVQADHSLKTLFKLKDAASAMCFGPGQSLIAGNPQGAVFVIDKDGAQHNLASIFRGKPFLPIVDLACRRDGSIYFTTRPLAESAGGRAQLGLYGVLPQVLPKGQDVDIVPPTLLIEKGFPAGLTFSVDENSLYCSDPEYNRITRYDLDKKGVPSSPRIAGQYRPAKPGALGPLRVDAKGNLYCTSGDGVSMIDDEGNFLGTVATPEPATGICWGGEDGRSLYVTTKTTLYRLKTKIGIKP